MPGDYTPTPINRTPGATVTALVDGDTINRDNNEVEAAPGVKPKLTKGYLLACIDGILGKPYKAGTYTIAPIFFSDYTGTLSMNWAQGSASASNSSAQVFEPPNGSTLTTLTFYVDPNNGTPPAGNKLQVKAYKRKVSDGTETQIGVTTTDPATGSGYGAAHSVALDCASEVIDRTAYVYYAILVGETSTGASFVNWLGTTYTIT